MRTVSWNVNGLRAAGKKAFRDHLRGLGPDVLLLQEVRAFPAQLPPDLAAPEGFRSIWHPATRPGYSGVATWSRSPMRELGRGLDADAPDEEGRVLVVEVDGVVLINTYLPSGSADERAQARKDAFCTGYQAFLDRWLGDPRPVLVGGDLNIAPTALDIHDAKANAKSSGFLPHERAWFAQLLDRGWSDLVREALGSGQGPYSWWSNRGQARALDRGWRIDHWLGNPAARARLTGAGIWRAGGLDTSDHAPVWIDLA